MNASAMHQKNQWIDKMLIYPGMEKDGFLQKVTVLGIQAYVLAMTIFAWMLEIPSLLTYGVSLIVIGILTTIIYKLTKRKNMDWLVFAGMVVSMLITFYFMVNLGGIVHSAGLIMAGPVLCILSLVFRKKNWTTWLVVLYLLTVLATAFLPSYISMAPQLTTEHNLIFFTSNTFLLGGFTLALILSLFDQQHKAVEARRAKSDRVNVLNQIKSKFFSNLTGTFKSPLTEILNIIDLLEKRPDDYTAVKLQQIRNDGKFMLHTINQMIDMAKLEAGQLKINKIQSDFIKFTKFITVEFQQYASIKQISIAFKTNFEQFNLDFDPEKILSIFSTIISDAILRSPVGGEINVTVNKEQENSFKDLVEIIIWDKGTVIEEKRLKLIFDPESQNIIEGQDQAVNSTLGFAFTGELVRLLGGKIFVRSNPGKGTKFRIQLPVQNATLFKGHGELISKMDIIPNFLPVPFQKEPVVSSEEDIKKEESIHHVKGTKAVLDQSNSPYEN